MTDLDRLRTHARTIVEGEGAEEFSPALVEAVARTISKAHGYNPDGVWQSTNHDDQVVRFPFWRYHENAAREALSTIRKHKESRNAD